MSWPGCSIPNSRKSEAAAGNPVKSVRIHPKYFFIGVGGLTLIYILLCVLSVVFSRNFLYETLRGGAAPVFLSLAVFFVIPLSLFILLATAAVSMVRDFITNRTGSRFQVRLMAYFILTVIFASVPVTVITAQALYELLQFWRTVRITEALAEAQNFAVDAYTLRLERLEERIESAGFERAAAAALSPEGGRETAARILDAWGISAVQDFRLNGDGEWDGAAFAGDAGRKLAAPPGALPGFVPRDMPRDRDTVRYVLRGDDGLIRVVSGDLGDGFDDAIETLEGERERCELIDSLSLNLGTLLLFYYGVFFLPTLLMTLIIAISFTRRVSQPLMELTEATRRVAEGDFSIQILTRPRDELGLLVRSFNAMVRDLEKTRSFLVRSEKISIWQSMAQQLAHEIKNPLTPIKLSAERVLRRLQNEPERVGEILESSMLTIIQEVESLSILLKEFHTLSRPIEPALTWTPLKEAVEEAVNPYRTAHPRVEFDTVYIQNDVSVKMDKRHIIQILTNLIINGIDAMDGAGQIVIRTDLVKKRESRYCRLSVRDSGKGIRKENYGKVFNPYFTTKESGTGLGLPIVERIVNDHGGMIWFNSGEGAGTTFFIDFPLDDAVPDAKFEKGAKP
jgi:nitrogen fixation/metabolism regulation signal transduction histidine kinase